MVAEQASGRASEDRHLLFEALLTELQLIRDEELICIQHVRKLPVTATYIVGFSMPIIASIFTLNFSGDPIAGGDWPAIVRALRNGGELAAMLSLGVAMICAAVLRVYMGAFKQIFSMACYIREHLAPALNTLIDVDVPVLHWENWLQENRRHSPGRVGDSDLSAEPNIIAGYSLGFASLALFLSVATGFFPLAFAFAELAILLVVGLSYRDFRRVLATSVGPAAGVRNGTGEVGPNSETLPTPQR